MRNLPLSFAILITMALSCNALSQVKLAPLAGTQIWGRDVQNDSPFLGVAASIKMNRQWFLSFEYQGWNSEHEHSFDPQDRTSPYSPKLLRTSKKQLLLAGLQYDLFSLSKKSNVIAGLHLGYQRLKSKNRLLNPGSYIPSFINPQEENLLGISSLSLNFELFQQASLFGQLRYGHRLSNLDGSGISKTRHFAQLLVGMDLLIF